MTELDNSKAGDGYKALEENPEQTDTAPEIEDDSSELSRYEGNVSTDLGGKDVSDLL